MRYNFLSSMLLLILCGVCQAQTPFSAYSGNLTMGKYTSPFIMTQALLATPLGPYSGRTPTAGAALSTPMCVCAANIQQFSPTRVLMSISVGGPTIGGGACTASYEASGTLGSDLTLTLVNGVAPFAWPASITLTKTTSAVVID